MNHEGCLIQRKESLTVEFHISAREAVFRGKEWENIVSYSTVDCQSCRANRYYLPQLLLFFCFFL